LATAFSFFEGTLALGFLVDSEGLTSDFTEADADYSEADTTEADFTETA
jgi:hypothetical protein